jgi:hypothetical protein
METMRANAVLLAELSYECAGLFRHWQNGTSHRGGLPARCPSRACGRGAYRKVNERYGDFAAVSRLTLRFLRTLLLQF